MQTRRFASPFSPVRMFHGFLLLALLLAATACASGSDTPDGDGDTPVNGDWEDGDIDGDRVDGDLDETDDTPNCFVSGCDEGFYCDEYDGTCKGCTTDLHCGHPDPVSGIVPVCRNGRCLDVACGTVLALPSPPDGVSLGIDPLTSLIGADGQLAVGGKPVFPVGVSGLNPEHFDRVRQAGGNLVVSTRDCCTDATDLDYQLNTFLPQAKRSDLYAALYAVSPVNEFEANDPFMLLESFRNRANHPALMAWLSGEGASGGEDMADALAIHDEIRSIVTSKVVGFGENWDANLNAYEDKGAFFLVSANPASTSPGTDLARLARKPVWARINTADFPATDYLPVALHTIAHGAKGLVFAVNAEANLSLPGDWSAVAEAMRYIRDRTLLWLLPRETNAVRVTEAPPEVASLAVHYEGKIVFVFLVNAATQARDVSLRVNPANFPYCMGVEQEERVLHMTRDQDITLSLPPRSIKVLQITEALPPGEDGGGR